MVSMESSVTSTGSPTLMTSFASLGRRLFLPPLVQTRWEPQIAIGTSGAPESRAMIAAPCRSSLTSKEREIVASGKIPTSSPAFSRSMDSLTEAWPSARSTGMWRHASIGALANLLSQISFFAMKRTRRPPRKWAGMPP